MLVIQKKWPTYIKWIQSLPTPREHDVAVDASAASALRCFLTRHVMDFVSHVCQFLIPPNDDQQPRKHANQVSYDS
jgi:hypothetical protein